MSKNIKKTALIIIGFIIMLFTLAGSSNAVMINSFSSVAYNPNYYCLNKDQHNQNYATSYYAQGTYTIKGNKAARGNTTDNTSTISSEWNGTLAYVLMQYRGIGSPYYDNTVNAYLTGVWRLQGQRLLWRVMPSWYSSVGSRLGAYASYGAPYKYMSNDASVLSAAKSYARSISSQGVVNNTNLDAITVEAFESNGETLVRVGPFNITYPGTFTSFTLTGNDGINIPIRSYERYSGSTLQTISAPSSGQDFYVTISVPENVHTIEKMALSSKGDVIQVGFTIYRSQTGEQDVLEKEHPHYEQEDYYGEWEINIDLFGKMLILKVDETTGTPLPNVGFTLQMVKGVKAGQYVHPDADGHAVYTDEPVTIITDENGEIFIDQMWMGDYELIETVNPNYGYYIDGELPKVIGTYTVNPGATAEVTATNLRRWIKLSGKVWEEMVMGKESEPDYLYSEGSDDKLVANVTVKLLDSNGNPVPFNTETEKGLTEILTDENGYYQMWDIEIEKLDQYYIQFTYNGMSYDPVPIVDLSPTNENSSKAAENLDERAEFNRKYSEITHSGTTGPVGESRDDTGSKTYDLNYDTDEFYDGSNQRKSTLNYGANAVYGYDGQKFPVNMTDEQYIMHASTKDAYQQNGQSGYLTDFASVDEIRQGMQEEIKYINLGIKEREQPDLALVEDIEKVQVSLNGYVHTYNYDDRFSGNTNTDGFNVGVKFANEYGSAEYTQAIYSSDVVYNDQYTQGEDGPLDVYVRYKIALRNEGTNIYTRVNEIVNYFDTRYTVSSIEDDAGNTYSFNSEGAVGEYNKITIQVNQELASQETKYVYITYQLNNDAINAVLNDNSEFTNNPLDSITEITSYSSYSDAFSTHYAGVDKDSRPGSAEPANRDTFEDDTDSAPAFKLEVAEGRVIAGTVFEDTAVQEFLDKVNNTETGEYKERIGDGTYTTGENVIQGVTVDLIVLSYNEADEIDLASANILGEEGNPNSSTIAKLYQGITNADKKEVDATYETGADGSYRFDGVIPGQYLLRFTYKQESIICDTNGNEIKKLDDLEKYKSTIYRGNRPDNEATSAGDTDYWYRAETSGEGAARWSDARDEIGVNRAGGKYDLLEDRLNPEKEFYYGNTTLDEGVRVDEDILSAIEARTRGFEIKMDYDINLDNMSSKDDQLKFVFDNMDFGIIRRPIQRLTVEKQVAYVKLTLANGQVLIEGNPNPEEGGGLQYVRFLPDGNIHIELDSEIMQGATLTVRYKFVADNTESEIDYNDENYYIFGTPKNPNSLIAPRIKRLHDYLSNDLIFDSDNSPDWHQYEASEVEEIFNNKYLSQDVYDTVKGLNQILWSDAYANIGLGRYDNLELQVSKVLSNNVNDPIFDNDIEINILTGRRTTKEGSDDEYTVPGNYIPSDDGRIEGGDDDYRYITVTGPTGEDLNYIPFIILGVVVFVILGAGVVIIKKKVL